MSPQNSRHAYGALLVALLSLTPAAHAQSACGLQGFSSCGPETRTDAGCCPIGWKCYATECSYTGTSTLPATTTTACPGVPAHHLCPQSLGGNCCYKAHACDPDNASQCILTQTQRVFDWSVTTTTVVGDSTQTIISPSLFYPWPGVTPRETPRETSDPVAESKTESETTAALETTTTATATQAISTGAAGHIEARIGGVIGGIVAGLLV